MSVQQPLGYSSAHPMQPYGSVPVPYGMMAPTGAYIAVPPTYMQAPMQSYMRGPSSVPMAMPTMPMGAPVDFLVQARSDKPVRRDLDIDPLHPSLIRGGSTPGNGNSGGGSDFSFLNDRTKDAFDFVQEHLKKQ